MHKEIPKELIAAMNGVAKKYSESKSTTNAGSVLRFLSRFITAENVIKLFSHKLK